VKKFLSGLFKKRAARKKPRAPEQPPQQSSRPAVTLYQEEGSDKVIFKSLVLYGPDGKPFIDYGDLTLSPGDRMMLSGPAGCGKSAGLAALRNAWLLGGSGDITVPPEVRFVPQEEYFPDRTLRGIVCAPDATTDYTTEDVVKALTDAGLSDFTGAMDDETKRGEYWKNTLSGGQKNKLAFAGVFLHAEKTRVLVVDEITAALDVKSEAELYPLMLERMKHGIVITVAHHATVTPMHNVFGVVAGGKVTYSRTTAAQKPRLTF
jgi:putative ATP-binding cassette transporter